MDARIRIAEGSVDDLGALARWLNDEDEFRGRAKISSAPIGDTELGSLPDVLSVAVGAGGMGTVLATSIRTWLLTRRTHVKLTIETAKGSATFELATIEEATPVVLRVLDVLSDDE